MEIYNSINSLGITIPKSLWKPLFCLESRLLLYKGIIEELKEVIIVQQKIIDSIYPIDSEARRLTYGNFDIIRN